MTLSFRHKAIKDYIEMAHKDGKQPKISEISKAFGITCDDVRKALAEIRKERESGIGFFKDLFGL